MVLVLVILKYKGLNSERKDGIFLWLLVWIFKFYNQIQSVEFDCNLRYSE